MTITITTAELLDALATASRDPEDAHTVGEIADHCGITPAKALKAIHKLHLAKRVVVHRVTRTAIDGRQCRVPAYTILPAPMAKRGR